MLNYRLIAADYDGTLLPFGEKTVSDLTVSAIKKAKEKGVKFVLSTGRPLLACADFFNKIGDDDAKIIQNGAEVYFGNEKIFEAKLNKTVADFVLSEGRKRNVTVVCWLNDRLYTEKDDEKLDEYKKISGIEPIIIDDLSKINDKKPTKYLWYADEIVAPAYAEEMRKLLKGEANAHTSRPPFVEFVAEKASKANALKIVCEYLSVPIESVIAFGDGENDAQLLKAAGYSVAMGNACDSLKMIAKEVCLPCAMSGFAKYVLDLLEK